MKLRIAVLSAFCALSTLALFASQYPEDRTEGAQRLAPVPAAQPVNPALAPAQSTWDRSKLNKYINLKSFFAEVGAFFAEDNEESFEKRKLLRFGLHAHLDRLPELFSLEKGALEKYFNTRNLKAYFRLCSDATEDVPRRKVSALKKSFNFAGWDTLLQCSDTQTIINLIIDLFYFKGETEEKSKKLQELKAALLAADTPESRLRTYFNIDDLHAIIDEMLAGNEVSSERIAKTVNCAATLALMPNAASIEKYSRADKLLLLLVTIICADDTENISIMNGLIKFIRWSELVEYLSTETAEGFMNTFFNVPALKRLIELYQDDQPLTKGLILDAFNLDTLSKLGISLLLIDQYVDFNELISTLHAWRSGKKADISGAIDVERAEAQLGVDIQNAVDTTIPERVQFTKMLTLYDQFTNTEWFPPLKYWTTFFGAQLALWAAGHYALFTSGIKSKLVGIPVVALILYLAYRSNRFFSVPITGRAIFVNTLICKGLRFFSSVKKKRIKAEDLINQIPDDHPIKDTFVEFFQLLTPEHLAKLPNPYLLIEMVQDDPIEFISKEAHAPFVESLCTIDPEQAQKRLIKLYVILKTFQMQALNPLYKALFERFTDEHIALLADPEQDLQKLMDDPMKFRVDAANRNFLFSLGQIDPARAGERLGIFAQILNSKIAQQIYTYGSFVDSLTPDITKWLPHQYLILVARFCPSLLLSKSTTAFMKSLGQERFDLLVTAIETAKAAQT